MASGSSAEVHATFGFGSNSVRQLRGRLDDPKLLGYPAVVRGQALAFAGPNYSWAQDDDGSESGTATLIPMPDDVALGTVCFLSEKQLETLDGFEGVPYVYDRRQFSASVLRDGKWYDMPVIAYIKVNSAEWYPPSEAYRCACLRNIRGSFPLLRTLTLRDTDGRIRGEWQHPGYHGLSAGALLFEVGVRAQPPWTLPRAINDPRQKLLQSGAAGAASCWKDTESMLKSALESEDLKTALRITQKSRLHAEQVKAELTAAEEVDLSLSDDEAQAERSPTLPERVSC